MKSKNICRWCKKNGLLCMLLIILLICSFSPTIEGVKVAEGGDSPAPNSGKIGGISIARKKGTAPQVKKKKTAKQEAAEQAAGKDRKDGR
jgi:hypothetical protein